MSQRLKRFATTVFGMAVALTLAFGAQQAVAEVRAGSSTGICPFTLPWQGECDAGCNNRCNAVGDPYAGGACMWNAAVQRNCCKCQL